MNTREAETSLDLSNCYNTRTSNALTLRDDIDNGTLAEKINTRGIDTVYFESNSLGLLTDQKLDKFISHFKGSSIKKLYLGDNFLSFMTIEDVDVFFKQFNDTAIEELHLDNNGLYEIGQEKFEHLLIGLQNVHHLTLLNLSNNNLWWLGKCGLAALHDYVKKSHVQTLMLDDNKFEYFIPKTYADMGVEGHAGSLAHHLENNFLSKDPVSEIRRFSYISGHSTYYKPNQYHVYAHSSTEFDTLTSNFSQGRLPQLEKVEQRPLVVEPLLAEIQKSLNENQVKYGNLCTLKNLCMLTIFKHPEINWQVPTVDNNLQDDLAVAMVNGFKL